jgi:hypothetical protein
MVNIYDDARQKELDSIVYGMTYVFVVAMVTLLIISYATKTS